MPNRNDYIAAAKASVAENAKWYPRTVAKLQRERKDGTHPRNLEEYTGTYWDAIHVFKIEVFVKEGSLYWALQGLESAKFRLDHYHHDVITWLQTRNELAKRGRWVDQGTEFWKVDFKANDKGRIEKLMWMGDGGVPAKEYRKLLYNRRLLDKLAFWAF